MPLLTPSPSRIAIAVLCFSLVSFLWTFGFPHQFGQPAQPVIDHYDHKNVHSEPIIPAPIIPTPTPTPTPNTHASDPDGYRDQDLWVDVTKAHAPTGTGSAEPGQEGGRWEDQQKTTLLTATRPGPTGASDADTSADASNTDADTNTWDAPSTNTHLSKFCMGVRSAPHVMVILRTSKAEIEKKLPAHLQGLLSCVPNFAIFSDHAGEINGIPVHNALDSIGSEAERLHEEFREYRVMHADPEHKPDKDKTKNLDKWKFLPMVYKAFQLNSKAKFYLFIEADTSLSWTNTLQWVNRLDYRIPYYSGAPTFINSVQLAQRGSGILLSWGALRRYAKSYDELYTSKWEVEVGKGCCGDLALAQALSDASVEFYSSWPLMQGEHPASLDYTKSHWCVPAVTWHHTDEQVLNTIWESQKNWTAKYGWEKPYLYRDAFESFAMPYLEAKKEKWDNLSQDTKIVAPQGRQQQIKEEEERSRKHQEEEDAKKESERLNIAMGTKPPSEVAPPKAPLQRRRDDKKQKEINWDKLGETYKDAGDSADKCQKTCEQIENCLQWRYASNKGDGECHLSKVLRLGKKTVETDDKWTSGWLVDRIQKTTQEWACKKPEWKFYQ